MCHQTSILNFSKRDHADALARALEEGDGKATLAALRYELPNCGGVPDAG